MCFNFLKYNDLPEDAKIAGNSGYKAGSYRPEPRGRLSAEISVNARETFHETAHILSNGRSASSVAQ